MIDTVRLRSPYISEELAFIIECNSFIRQGIDCVTGDLHYQFTSSELKGSYDTRIHISVQREEWSRITDTKSPVKIPCKPYLIIECSVHKIIVGHNLYGGSSDFHFCIWHLIDFIEKNLNVKLPCYLSYMVDRLDYAKCYIFDEPTMPTDYISSLNLLSYPRRKDIYRYGNETIFIKGTTTVLKFYYKGSEFSKHDRLRLKQFIDSSDLFELSTLANRLLRVEVEFKKKKLKDLFGKHKCQPLVTDINMDVIKKEYQNNINKFLIDAGTNQNRVYMVQDIQRLLFNKFDTGQAGTLFGFWLQMISLGEESVKSTMKKATFYKYRKLLKDLNISFNIDSNYNLDKKNSIADFSPTLDSSYIFNYELLQVNKLYNNYIESQTDNYKLQTTNIS